MLTGIPIWAKCFWIGCYVWRPLPIKSSAGLYSGDECDVWTIKSGGGEDVKIFSVKDADADDAGDDADADDGGGDAAEVDAGDDEVDDVDADADDDDDAGGGGQLIVMSLSSVTAATAQ